MKVIITESGERIDLGDLTRRLLGAGKVIHFVSVSGGKDSLAVALLARDRAARRGMALVFIFADTGNEHELTIAYLDYLEAQLGAPIIRVQADFADDFAARREQIPDLWSKERRRLKHGLECNRRREAIPKLAPGCRHSPERTAALRAWVKACDCPEVVSEPVEPELIARAVAALHPTGNPFLDLCMLKGRFPGVKSRFCTDLLKLVPMEMIKNPLLESGISVVEWIGERAQESQARAKKPGLERQRRGAATRILYRPIHGLTHAEVFAIAKAHGVKPNQLYLQGMNRVGCMPCIMVKKDELREIARRFPEHIDRLAEWESIVRAVSRRGNATFLAAKVVPGAKAEDETRASIRRAVLWANTSHGGWNFDIENFLADDGEVGLQCASAYGLCE